MRGNKNIKDYSPMVDNSPVDIDENRNMIECVLDTFNSQLPDLHNEQEVKEAITGYFNSCIKRGLRPGNMGLYTALGMTKREVFELVNGKTPGKASVASIEHIKKAQRALSNFREILGNANKLSAPVLIFWQKNFDGLEDIQRVDVAPVNTLTADKTPEQIASEIPVDTE